MRKKRTIDDDFDLTTFVGLLDSTRYWLRKRERNMSEYQGYYDNYCRANVWATNEPEECGCRGSGYWASEVDTWHQCPYHFEKGQGHPEDDEEEMKANAKPVHSLKLGGFTTDFIPSGSHVRIEKYNNMELVSKSFMIRQEARDFYRRLLNVGWQVF
jgi:hypothetical protein